jgi:uncharacterized protein YbjT (DUF2867 family)
MPIRPVLVTGAAGGPQGQTGRHVSELLLASGVPVRAFVHRLDDRSARLRALGAEVVQGDFLDVTSVQRAVQGVASVYFAYPVQEGLLDAAAIMAFAARAAGVGRLVNMVMLQSSADAPTPRMRQNYLSEQVFNWAEVGAVHVRATVFYENVRALFSRALATGGPIQMPWRSDTLLPLVSGGDVARVVVGVLRRDAVPAGTAVPLVGEMRTVRDVIATVSRVLGRDIQYAEISDEDWRRGALAAGFNQHAIDHLSALWRYLRTDDPRARVAGLDAANTIAEWGGAPPTSFEAFARAELTSSSGTVPAQRAQVA